MHREFVVFLHEDTTEEEQKELAKTICCFPYVLNVYRPTIQKQHNFAHCASEKLH